MGECFNERESDAVMKMSATDTQPLETKHVLYTLIILGAGLLIVQNGLLILEYLGDFEFNFNIGIFSQLLKNFSVFIYDYFIFGILALGFYGIKYYNPREFRKYNPSFLLKETENAEKAGKNLFNWIIFTIIWRISAFFIENPTFALYKSFLSLTLSIGMIAAAISLYDAMNKIYVFFSANKELKLKYNYFKMYGQWNLIGMLFLASYPGYFFFTTIDTLPFDYIGITIFFAGIGLVIKAILPFLAIIWAAYAAYYTYDIFQPIHQEKTAAINEMLGRSKYDEKYQRYQMQKKAREEAELYRRVKERATTSTIPQTDENLLLTTLSRVSYRFGNIETINPNEITTEYPFGTIKAAKWKYNKGKNVFMVELEGDASSTAFTIDLYKKAGTIFDWSDLFNGIVMKVTPESLSEDLQRDSFFAELLHRFNGELKVYLSSEPQIKGKIIMNATEENILRAIDLIEKFNVLLFNR